MGGDPPLPPPPPQEIKLTTEADVSNNTHSPASKACRFEEPANRSTIPARRVPCSSKLRRDTSSRCGADPAGLLVTATVKVLVTEPLACKLTWLGLNAQETPVGGLRQLKVNGPAVPFTAESQ